MKKTKVQIIQLFFTFKLIAWFLDSEMLPNCALFLLLYGWYFLSHMPADCMVRWECVGWLGEVRIKFDFKFIIITTFVHSVQALKSQGPDIWTPKTLDNK